MRWSGQQLGVDQAGTLPGLARLNNLVRSVQTPEFAGITFHEVLAKSALNHVPGASSMPFTWTVNPYRGCSHACVYCIDPDTQIAMSDGREKPLWAVEVGDEILGTRVEGRYRRYTPAKVLAKWSTYKPAYRITLGDGTQMVASGDHRFLTERGWKHVTGAMSGPGQRPYLTTGNSLMGFGRSGIRSQISAESASTTRLAAADTTLGKLAIAGAAIKSSADLRVVSIEPLGGERELMDITTTTGDFIANGVVSHNCFARPTHTYLDLDAGDDFDRQIIVKVNVAEVLTGELAKRSWRHEPVALGTNTDPYQRAEGRYKLMPGIIDAFASSGTPFSILTKGTLLRRDLAQIADAAGLVPVDLAMSIAVYDDELQQAIEPGTPTTKARLATVTAVREAGLDCSVFLMPILPYLTDTRAHLDEALRQIKAAGATSVVYSALHLRPGVKTWFMQWLAREHPELEQQYRSMYYGQNSYAPKEYRKWLAARVSPLVRAHGLERGREDPVTGGVRSAATRFERHAPQAAFPADPAALF